MPQIPLLILLVLPACAAGEISPGVSPPPLAQLSASFAPSTIEPLAPVGAGSLPAEEVEEAQQFLPTIPGVITTEMPEIEQLASWQSAYLGLLGDEGLALAGFYDPFSYQFAYGQDGAQPYRLGWFSYNDFVLMSRAPTTIGGNFQDLEWNAWVRYARQLQRPLVFSWTGWMNGKFWSGPTGINLPPGAAQFVSDFQLASNYDSVWNWQLGFAPQLDGTFNDHINSNALMADVRAVLFYRSSPQWMFAMGTAFWNRASDHLIPYGGVLWTPDDRWELRFMFPRSRASYYVGRIRGADAWLYASGEYYLDAYQVDIEGPRVSTRGEVSDYRVLVGASATTGIWTLFFEGGLVTDRHFRFRGDATDFALDDCGMFRTGLLF